MGELPKGRVLGVDAGTVRTGLAISDTDGFLASVLCTVKANGLRSLAAEIKTKAEENKARLIVIGHPINMNGSRGDSSSKVQYLAGLIEKDTGVPVKLFDERCTTMLAHKILNTTDTRGTKRKNVVDTLSAQIILQNYLDMHR